MARGLLSDNWNFASNTLCLHRGGDYNRNQNYGMFYLNYNSASNADTKTMTISGDGAYAGATNETQPGSGTYHTVILGANVSRLLTESLNAGSVNTIVFFAPADAPVVLDDKILNYTNFRPKYLTVYTDNKALREYTWMPKVSVTLHSLSEWAG